MDSFHDTYGFSKEEWEACIHVLQTLKGDPLANPDNQLFGTLITKVAKKAKKQLIDSNKQEKRDIEVIKSSIIAKNALNKQTFYGEESDNLTSSYTASNHAIKCYSCLQMYQKIHSFYHRLCPSCAELNFAYRSKKVDLSNRNVILTGGRVKVGYATALKFLRCNANLTITTRFPALAYHQFKKERDFDLWKDRLLIYGLDLRILKDVERFIEHYGQHHSKLDILVNNAAQTIKYDDTYTNKLISSEIKWAQSIESNMCLLNTTNSQVEPNKNREMVLHEELNRFGQPIDKREKNSWYSKLEEIDLVELLEVNLINQISPYLLIKELAPLLKASEFDHRFIINVTSSEGQFSYAKKTMFHPHTNMTKAALNMLTLTSFKDLMNDNIYMNSVDVGWISTGATESLRKTQFENGVIPPLDPVDGAARILHPIYEKIVNNNEIAGKLVKNYKIDNW